MDITEALAPTSDQLDAIELVEPRTFTIDSGSRLGRREGKTVAEIRLVCLDRVWRPSKGMLDVLADLWGTDAKQWVGRRVTLYNKKDVMYGGAKVGGIRISHMSHIDGPRKPLIRASGQGRKQEWPVLPLSEPATEAPRPTPEPTPADIAACTDLDTLERWWRAFPNGHRARDVIMARIDEVRAAVIDREAEA